MARRGLACPAILGGCAALLLAIVLASGSGSARAESRRRSGLLSVPLSQASGWVGALGKSVIEGVQKAFGIDASLVPVVALDGESFVAIYKEKAGADPRRVLAFAHGGTVFVREYVLGVNKIILVHEVLHALSPTFTAEAQSRGLTKLVEGMTDYFTHQIARQRRFNEAGPPRSAYGLYEDFARQLAAVVGEEALRECYFRRGYSVLERRVDAAVGRGRLLRAARRLQADDPSALRELRSAGGEITLPEPSR